MILAIEAETTVARAPADVYRYLAAIQNLPAWVADIRTAEPLDGAATTAIVGGAFQVRLAQAPITATIRWTAVEAGRTLAWEGNRISVGIAAVVPRGRIDLEPSGTGTRVRAWIEPELSETLRLARRFIARELREGRDADLRRLRERLEAAGESTA